MKLHELYRLNEETHTIQEDVRSLNQLRGKDGEYFTGTVNVAGNVSLNGQKLERLPVRFGTVDGYFNCSNNRLSSLEGAPSSVSSHFNCSWNRLTSLEGAPSSVGGNFGCGNNRLTSLESAPGAVGGHFYCGKNRLTTLVGVHKILKRIGGELFLAGNEIASGGIGLILVEGLTEIYTDQPAFKIINKYLGQGNKGVLRCQEALHEAGLEEFAKL